MSGVAAIGGDSRAWPNAATHAGRPLRTIPTWALGTFVRFMTSSTAARTLADSSGGRESISTATCCAATGAAAPTERTRAHTAERTARWNEQDIEGLRRGCASNVWPMHRRGEDWCMTVALAARSGRRQHWTRHPPPGAHMRIFSRGAVAVALLATAATSGAQVPKNVDAAMNGFDAYIAKVMKDWDAPGLGIGIVVRDSLVWAKGYGYRDYG